MSAVSTAARTAWGEARGEGVTGMQAVLNVIGNRAAHPGWWGHNISAVCTMPYQFSCWNEDDPNLRKLLTVTDEDPLYRSAQSMATRLVAGTLPDITRGSDSYYATNTPKPRWASGRAPQVVIGHHAFYRVGLTGTGVLT
ncbi:cell wall hydrolase [Kozakia baliensis]|uniref:cell wall hydrolase n=1 Tax=Kozakia baliensis TaxID=153496 RepID=UPI00049674CB|nr:cell wall hydrolase [Kozakia baliensis]